MIKRIIQGILVNLGGLWIAELFLTGFEIQDNLSVYLVAAVVMMLVNFIVKPVINIITFPINIITLGFFGFIINMGLLYLVVTLVNGITLSEGFLTFRNLGVFALTFSDIELSKILTLLVATLIISSINWLLHKLVF